ncbi:hypothetical protein KIN20_029351 [Parelaphostrongylus tenuis]|uniref:Uncharacterized protein n=1 Tax=Parelaphostrongylus tenuis TaxID=148309 RepID=A0AAD5R2A5_PARTN|nr:hypothetical protein KIN20_029351 [Parelaphostrongylus tenuis]
MDGRPYIKSYYCANGSKTKKEYIGSEMSDCGFPTAQQDVVQVRVSGKKPSFKSLFDCDYSSISHDAQVKPLQTSRLAPEIEQCLSKLAAEKPFLESSYCEVLKSYSTAYFMENRPDTYNIDYFKEDRPNSSQVEYNVNAPAIAQLQCYQPDQDSLKHPVEDKPINACIKSLAIPCDTIIDEKDKAKTYVTSEYAWQRQDEEAAKQYALPYQRYSTIGKNDEVDMNQYSEYIGIPNDLYLVYRSKPFNTYITAPRLSAQPPSNNEVRNVGPTAYAQHPPSSATKNDPTRSKEIADEIPPQCSDFSTQIKHEHTEKLASTRSYGAARYTLQDFAKRNSYDLVLDCKTPNLTNQIVEDRRSYSRRVNQSKVGKVTW